MQAQEQNMKKRKIAFGNQIINIAVIALVLIGSLMIVSAEMGNKVGDTQYLKNVAIKQALFVSVGLFIYFVLMNIRLYRTRIYLYYGAYVIILIALLSCRFFGQANGAYAWIRLGQSMSIQPSEFAKVFMIGFAGKILGKNNPEKNMDNLIKFAAMAGLYFVIILFYQHDLGTAIVLLIICYCMAFIPDYKEYRKCHRIMSMAILAAVGGALILMSPPFTEFLKKHADNYMVGRFLASADPFLYQYDSGYHLIMSLVSFANGGLTGLGYGNSIHKYMNFPNPSNDFILPVIVEEFGAIGFLVLVIVYACLLYPILSSSLKVHFVSGKITLLGVFMYFICHFILNVGGVSGLIPLTGVPLLMISSGGSSLVACLAALGLGQSEIIRNRDWENENNSREI